MDKMTTTTDLKVMNEDWRNASLVDIRLNPEKFPRICRYPRESAMYHMSTLISQAMMLRGQEVEKNNVQFIAYNLLEEILSDKVFGCRYISFEELRRVIRAAVLQKEIFINVASLYKEVLIYVKGEGMLADKKAYKINEERGRVNVLEHPKIKALATMVRGEILNKSQETKRIKQ